jgi:hypothetical protein
MGKDSFTEFYLKMKNLVSKSRILVVLAIISLSVSCKKDEVDTPDENKSGMLSLEFDNIIGDETLRFDSQDYTNAAGEKFSITTLKYFVSNIKLKKADGSEYVVPQADSYFMVDGRDEDTRFAKVIVPEGNYTSVSFVLGVDSLQNYSPIENRTGVLNLTTSSDMYWSWNSGYIFFKLEGISPAINDSTGINIFRYHIGGFKDAMQNIREVNVNLNNGESAQVREGLRSNIHMLVDIKKVFDGTNSFSIAQYPTIMVNPFSMNISANFFEMFKHDHTENFAKVDGVF